MITGHYYHRYQVRENWGTPATGTCPVKDCHEMVIDARGRIFLLTNDTANNILIYNKDGNILGYWGQEYPGAHGLTIHDENGTQRLYICDIERHQVIKTDLNGRVLLVIGYPEEAGVYRQAAEFLPTESAVAPNGDIYITDGYGLQYVIQYDSRGNYIRHWGGRGHQEDQFDCAHGITIDTRKGGSSLLITSRNHNAFKRFTLDGQYRETIYLPGSFVCRPVIKEQFLYAAVFRSGSNTFFGSGYITILDVNDRVVSTPGGSLPVYRNGKLEPQYKEEAVFIHPHDVCVDENENVYVCQWNSGQTYPILLERV
ncbi:6-bladed beta-propeller [Niabella beijingensis]|uniref:6-bladed beta-propeller n=1 Tax=Niabella beijingensis TaxID=2872700 RepID=UPI001CC0EB0C|nr:6-bladed beta-propeller [Niabella beijingensis]MBZ4190907.1 6-bladed beta-propeller [Niabella beijingensis]